MLNGLRVAFDLQTAIALWDGGGFDDVRIVGTSIEAVRGTTVYRGSDLVNVRFFESFPGVRSVTIQGHRPHIPPRGGPALSEYSVILDGVGDLCDTAGYPQVAMPIEGQWTPDGVHLADSTKLTFACADGVMFKCIDFGFEPWGTIFGWSIAGNFVSKDGPAFHQTCTRMARADYCADGTSHTINGTTIQYYDIMSRPNLHLDPVAPVPLDRPGLGHVGDPAWDLHFEAAWRPGSKGESAAICLTKKRWSTIPFEGYCAAGVLQDPRTHEISPTTRFCDDYDSESDLEDAGAILFNDSAFIDKGLYRWFNPGPASYTNSSFPDFRLRPTVLPPPPFVQPADFEGAVFNPDTAYLPPDATFVELWSYTGPTGFITTIPPAPPGFTPNLLEGLVYDPSSMPPMGAVALYLYVNGTQRYITTTNPVPPPGYTLVNRIGYLPH